MSAIALAAVLLDSAEMVTSGLRGSGPAALTTVGTATELAAKSEVEFAGADFVEVTASVTTAAFGAGFKCAGAGFDDDVAAAAA